MKNINIALTLLIGFFILLSCNNKKVSTKNPQTTIEKNESDALKISDTLVPINKIPENVASLEELFTKKESYAKKSIIISGKVTKINNGIMNRNWVHISDGTQFQDKKTLTVTTNETLAIGDLVTFKGTLVLNKDFGYNYVYDILLEQGEIIENKAISQDI